MRNKKVVTDAKMDIIELAHHLRREHLFVTSEKQQIQKLNEKVLETSSRLFHMSWITRQQRINLDRLLLSHANSDLLKCCHNANALDSVNLIDAYKRLAPNETIFAELFATLRKNPQLIGHCLMTGEKINGDIIARICHIIMSGVYCHCILHEDKISVLQLLKEILTCHLSESDNPRRALRHNSCAFSRIYRIFSEEIIDAKLFLTAALRNGVMQLLAEDDLFLDIDPGKAVVRFAPQERLRHFGQEGTATYATNLQKYRTWTINKLTASATKFIDGIRDNMYNFPQSLSWIVKQFYSQMIKKKRIEEREIEAMCADLVFGFFICPAIVNPDLYGITDAHISHIARFNLMQCAQIIQLLSMAKWEEIDPKLDDLYSKFPKDCMSNLLDFILEKSTDNYPFDHLNIRDMTRTCVLISEFELKLFVQFLHSVKSEIQNQSKKKIICELMERVPLEQIVHETVDQTMDKTTKLQQSSKHLNASNTPNVMNDNSPKSRKSILNRVTRRGRITNDTQKPGDGNAQNMNISTNDKSPFDSQSINNLESSQISDVIVISISGNHEFNCIGMLSEEKVLRIEQQKRHTKVRMNLDMLMPQTNSEETESVMSAVSGSETATEKRTRFSLSQDQESIGTSDNLEAISEAASNHSVESSIDLENENDNMSDMVSANVSSGRGTPNVSGRDTPSSHSPNHSNSPSSDEEVGPEPLENRVQPQVNPSQSNTSALNAINRPQRNRPNNRDDIEDKFGKFDIKPIASGDETKSMISDTWSTDVLASDSEAFEQPDSFAAVTASMTQNTGMNMLGFPIVFHQSHALQAVLDSSETASQSDAWSTDVLTSDTERMQEFDDSASITRSDDMSVTRSEPDEENFVTRVDLSVLDNEFLKDGTIKYKNNHKLNASNNSNVFQDSQETIVGSLSTSGQSSKVSVISNDNLRTDNITPLIVDVNECVSNTSALTPIENIDISPVPSPTSGPSLLSTNMQSLGRLSFDIRKFDENSTKLTIQESTIVGLNLNNRIKNNRSSVAELLVDLSQSNDAVNDHTTNVKTSNSLIDFDGEISNEKQSQALVNDDIRVPETASSIDSRFSFTSISSISTNSSANSEHQQLSQQLSQQSSQQLSQQLSQNKNEHFNTSLTNSSDSFASTGAIPKNPNYSKLRIPINRSPHHFGSNDDDLRHPSNRKSFFKLPNFKFREKMRSFKDVKRTSSDSMNIGDSTNKLNHDDICNKNESSDEILAKYRAKTVENNVISDSSKTPFNGDLLTGNDDGDVVSEIDESEIFNKTKRKIRKVLGNIDVLTFPVCLYKTDSQRENGENELLKLLKVLLAEAINLRHSSHIVMLHEAVRSIESLDNNGCQKLFWSLREDYQKRSSFIAYLTRSRQQLLSTLAFFESVLQHIEHDKVVCCYNLISISVRQFLEKKEKHIQIFIKKFQSLIVADEKAQLVEKFLNFLFNILETDSSWQSANEEQLELAKQVIERHVMCQIYILALYPNGDGDVLRDQILYQHIENLSKVISPNHKDLGIPKMYHSECPWPSAQTEILAIGAHKTPRDKVRCVVRCCSTIMNLLSLAYDKSVPAADDLMPVLVFVLIKANPMSLLSTVQYVNSFYDKYFEGEESYWWTQFCSAVEFIKTMD